MSLYTVPQEYVAAQLRDNQEDTTVGFSFKTPPYKHQKVMFNFSRILDKCAYLADIGVGKTLPAICTSIYRKGKDKVKRVLVITPASVKDNFAAEIRKNCDEDYVVLNGPLLWRKKILNESDKFFVITNYDSLSFLEINIIKKKFDMLIADEISYCKNSRAKRSKALYKIAQNISYKIILTGSLLTNTPLDCYMPFKILDERIFGTSFWRFKEQYCVFKPKYGAYGKYLEIVDFQNLDELQKNIYRVSIRYRREDCLDLPPKVYEVRNIELPIDIRKRYEQMKKELYLQYQNKEINAQNCLVKILKLAQITSGFISDDLGNVIPFEENPKLEELKDLLGEIDEKVIIWTRFRYSFEKILGILKDKAVGLCGDTKVEKRQELIDKFQTDDRCRYFIGMVSLGYGFNLTAGKVSIFYENDFSYQNRIQAEGRNYRAGQESKVIYIDMVCKDTIDEYVKKALERKENLAKMVMEILK